MNSPAAMPKKAIVTAPRPVDHHTPVLARAPQPSPQKTTVSVTTRTDGASGDIRINGRPVPAVIADHVDIELDSDGSGVVWVGLIADRIIVSPQSGRKR